MLKRRLDCAKCPYYYFFYLAHQLFCFFLTVFNVLLNPVDNWLEWSFVSFVVLLQTFIELKNSFIFAIYCVICQMHVQIFQIFASWFFVFFSAKPCESLFIQIYSEWLYWIYENVKSAVEFQAINQKWLFNVSLYNVVISWAHILSILGHKYSLALAGSLRFNNVDRSHVRWLV